MDVLTNIEEIKRLSQLSRLKLYGDTLKKRPLANSDRFQAVETKSNANDNCAGNVKTELEYISNDQTGTSRRLQNAVQIIKAQSEYKIPFLFRSEVIQLCNIKGGASVVQAENAALDNSIIIKHSLPRGKTNICFWEITDQGYKLLGKIRPVWKSKGKYIHKFCVHRIADQYQKQGYKTNIEACRSNGKLVDLKISKGQYVLYVEVCASWPIEKELSNIEKNLEGEFLPDEIILAVTERKMKKVLEDILYKQKVGKKFSKPVRTVLAGDMIKLLKKIK